MDLLAVASGVGHHGSSRWPLSGDAEALFQINLF